ncbi:hypothetical protein AAL_02497 [Moelleriella libera RCEF 2490]|uniref:37S ribosomal protein rsm22 n=1 Tax=Moelleriella libera RCEF 2490 TaxID=1081109 RepID=A0A168EM86_9HYPO|nr:hypothetical protein AAL_02497 [Moelleriella libera RCEF 2490]
MSSGCSLDVWPPVTPSELRRLARESLARDLAWIVDETVVLCQDLKHGIEDCYALLAPIDPGSTLVMSTHRNEKVKGTITRVGTRIVKGTLHLQLRTMPAHSITVAQPIHIAALDSIHTYLTQAIDLLGLTISSSRPPEPPSLASTLALLTECLSESITLLQGVPPSSSNTTTNNPKNSSNSSSSSSRNSPAPPSSSSPSPAAAAVSNKSSDTTWTTASCPAHHFSPAAPNISVHIALQESSIVVHLRALESADAPVNFGLKLGLAIGTVRRLEHDEMDTVFRYNPDGDGSCEPKLQQQQQQKQRQQQQLSGKKERLDQVYVREKVKVESADPSLIALHAKLAYLSHMLGQARHNLAAVMDVKLDDADS